LVGVVGDDCGDTFDATSLLDQAEVALRYVEHTFAARPCSTR
jgi:hypothetical protein